METPEPATRGLKRELLKALMALALVAAVLLAGPRLAQRLPEFAAWVEGLGVWGPVVFIAGYALAAVLFVPGSILTLAAGALFGLVRGSVYAFTGASLGAALAFLSGRYLARGLVERRLAGNPRVAAIDRAVGRQGRRIVTLLRMSPLVPYNLLNYALGLTRVRFLDYLVATLGMLPVTVVYVYYGKLAGEVVAAAGGARAERGLLDWGLLLAGLVATLAASALIARTAKRALAQAADLEQLAGAEETEAEPSSD